MWKTVERHRGRVVKSLGDGVMLTFDAPSPAVACADELRRDLGSDRRFEDRGEHTLKGVEGSWHLYEVVR